MRRLSVMLMSYHLFCVKFYDVIIFTMILYILGILGILEPEPAGSDFLGLLSGNDSHYPNF
jgi:hypothetical protein